jgi:hypothetical protein
MDIRDVLPVEEAPKDSTIETIFNKQEELLSAYLNIEKLEPWPYDLNSPSHQIILKDFIARVVEELGEGYESYEALVNLHINGQSENSNMIPLLFNFSEELADALHFLIETFIVCGITINDIREYIINQAFPNLVNSHNTYKLLAGSSYLIKVSHPGIMHNLGDPIVDSILGGKWVDKSQLRELAILSWEVTYKLQLARNSLKNKPWKQSHMGSDKPRFTRYLIESLKAFIVLTRAMGITEDGLFQLYSAKNQINQFRIRSKY